MNNRRQNQKGFSLVELVVVIAIMAVVGLTLYGFFHTSLNSYNNTGSEVDLQYEAQITQNQLDNLIIDSTKEVKYLYDTASSTGNVALSDQGLDKSKIKKKQFKIYNEVYDKDNNKVRDEIYTLEWDTTTSKIFLYKTTVDASGTTTTLDPSLLAEYVTDFEVNLKRVEKQRVVEFLFLYENGGKELQINHNITMRNRVHVNTADSGSEGISVFDVDIYKDVHDGTFLASNLRSKKVIKDLALGESIDLIAFVKGLNCSQKVTWVLTPVWGDEQNKVLDADTKLEITGDNTCKFTIGANEKCKEFRIDAKSWDKPSVSTYTTIVLESNSPGEQLPGAKGFIRGGKCVLDLVSLGVDMSKVADVEWGFMNVYIIENGGNVRNFTDVTADWAKIPATQLWKPLEPGQEAKDLQKRYDEDTDGWEKQIKLVPNLENVGQCTITVGSRYDGGEYLSADEAFQAVVIAKVTKKDGSVYAYKFGQNLENVDMDIEKMRNDSVYHAHMLTELRKDPLFMDSIHFKILKMKDENGNDISNQEVEFGDYADVPNSRKYGGWYGGLFIKSGESLNFRIRAYGYSALPDFECIDESQKTKLLDNYKFELATGEVFVKTKPDASGQLTFKISIPGGSNYSVPIYIDTWRETSK